MSFAGARNILITNGTFSTHNVTVQQSKDGFERLQESVAHGAFHDSGERFDPPKCHDNTRVGIIKKIMNWIRGLDEDSREALVLWLYGAAGAGKSAIAQTIADILDTEYVYLASFFFSRNDPRRGIARFLIPTLAYQLATKLPLVFRGSLVQTLEDDPLIVTRSLEAQFKALIRDPLINLFQSGFPPNNHVIIIIDGLDECDDRKTQARIVELSFNIFRNLGLPLKILIASRPEADINSSFASRSFRILTRVALDDDYQRHDDIRSYLTNKFHEIKTQHQLHSHIPETWPPAGSIDTLVVRSSGQFVYASTIIRYIASPRRRPTHRLEVVLGLHPPEEGDNPFAELDELYRHILMGAEKIDLIFKIIAFVLFGGPSMGSDDHASVYFIESFFSLKPGDIQNLMQDISGCLISFSELKGFWRVRQRIHILHASLKDFLVDRTRSRDLYLDPSVMHAYFAELSFFHIDTGSKEQSISMSLCDRMFYHTPHAEPSQQLFANVRNFTFSRWSELVEISNTNEVHYVPRSIVKYVQFLKSLEQNWDYPGVLLFVADETMVLHQHINSQFQLGLNIPHAHVYFLMACILLYSETYQWTGILPLQVDLPSMDLKCRWRTAQLGWDIITRRYNWHPDLCKIVCAALQDYLAPEQSLHAPRIYANASSFIMRCISAFIRVCIKQNSPRYTRTRTYNPAYSRWYRFRISTYKRELYKFLYSGGRVIRPYTHSSPRPWKSRNARRELCHLMDILSRFLKKSGYSEELINYSRRIRIRHGNAYYGNLKPYYPTWNQRRQTTNKAIEDYLKRVESGSVA